MGEMDRSACLESRTAGASLPRCLYADAVRPVLSTERKVAAEVESLPAISSLVNISFPLLLRRGF